jgi:hypothetical protein
VEHGKYQPGTGKSSERIRWAEYSATRL